MKIAILCRKDVSGWYAATLMERGHEVTISGGGALDLLPNLPSFIRRVCSGYALVWGVLRTQSV